MLVITRKREQSFVINDNITVTIRDIGGDSVKIAIDAPREVKILRSELVAATKENEAAAGSKADISALENLKKALK